ncbi:uncharacterized protein BDV17DRAFT_83375 [Aspergillus undulatus]|uniref:uncharacterized protein n=1 Tax=Aspergillus undulatus TaxID=1810928 RepID=UPI003CCE287C
MVPSGAVSRWAVLGLLQLGQLASALRTTPGSPCESRCSPTNDTMSSEIVCLDREYSDTEVGKKFKDCVGCQLESSFVDDISRESDVEWGLYNLRFAFSSCVYGFPEKVANLSNPCPVACEDLESPIEYQLTKPSSENLETWCDTASFADNEITDCGICYNLTQSTTASGRNSQVYMANFLESLRYNCHFRTPTEEEFPITPSRIFSESILPSSTADLISPDSNTNDNLALIIAMPILGFVILCCLLALGCFFFIRSRRKKVRRLRQPGHLHARWNDTGISTPQWAMEYPAQAQGHGMYNNPAIYSPQGMYASPQPEFAQYPPQPGSGFGFVDNDGRGQEVGYSKVVEPVIASPSTAYSPEEKGAQAQAQAQAYYPPPPPPNSGKMRQAS